MSSAALAFLAGMGGGYMKSKDKEYDRSRQEKLDAQRDELHSAQMAEKKQVVDDRTALKYAGETVTARPLEGPQPEAAYVGGQEPTQPIGYISGNGASARTFAGNGVGQEQATADAVQQNKPEARRTRMADLAAQGNAFAANALDFENKQVSRKREDVTWTQAQTAYTKKLKDEGVFDAAKAMRSGDAGAVAEAFNRSGVYKIVGEPIKTLEVRDSPGYGKVNTYNYSFDIQKPDGTIEKVNKNSHDVSTAIMPYEKQLEIQLKGNELTNSERKTDVSEKQAAIADRRMDYLIYGGAAGRARAGVGGGAPGVALKDRRDYLSDFSAGLEDPKTAFNANEAAAMQQRNQTKLVQADAIFSTNAEFGTVLTAPQARAAMSLAQDPKNVQKVQDNNTGTVYEVVNVSGKQVVVGTGSLKPKEAESNPAANDAGANKRAPAKLATQSGAHMPADSMKTTIKQTPPDVAARIRDLDAKLKLEGVDPQIRLQWMDEKRRISGGMFGGMPSIQQFKN
jgi:hypothetical protein